MTQYPDLFAALAAPFQPEEVRSRSQAGRQIHYITARVAMNRLDSVLGPENWWDEYVPGENSVLCKLTIRLPDGSTLTKCDAGGYAGMPDQGDDDKSGFSDSYKRAAVKLGVGRYLYRDGVPVFVRAGEGQAPREGVQLPAPEAPAPAEAPAAAPRDPGSHRAPATGRELFRWTKDQDERNGSNLIGALSDWAITREFPPKMVSWSAEQAKLGYAEVVRRIRSGEAAPRQGGGRRHG